MTQGEKNEPAPLSEIETEILEMAHYTGVGIAVYRGDRYSIDTAKLIMAPGLCLSAGGARSPISSISSYVDRAVGCGVAGGT